MKKVHLYFEYLHFEWYQHFDLLLFFFSKHINTSRDFWDRQKSFVFLKYKQNQLGCHTVLQSLHEPMELLRETSRSETHPVRWYWLVCTHVFANTADASVVKWG